MKMRRVVRDIYSRAVLNVMSSVGVRELEHIPKHAGKSGEDAAMELEPYVS